MIKFCVAGCGDISAKGSLVIVRGYFNASVWRRIAGMEVWEAFETEEFIVLIVIEPQGEAICFDGEGCGYYTVLSSNPHRICSFPPPRKKTKNSALFLKCFVPSLASQSTQNHLYTPKQGTPTREKRQKSSQKSAWG